MTDSSVLWLLRNAALLVAMAVVVDFATSRLRPEGRPIRKALAGAVLGLIGVAAMADYFPFGEGVIFDMRSVLLSVSGLFFGAIPAAVAVGMTAAFRFYEGGDAEWAGVAVILATGSLGIAWRHYRRGPLADITRGELYGFGVVVHLVMLAVLLAMLPSGTAWRVLTGIGVPILLVYPLATTALGLLLASRLRRERTAEELAASEARFRTFFIQSPVGMARVAPDGTLTQANPAFAQLVGYPSEELASLTMESIVHADDRARSRECARGLLAGERDACSIELRYRTKDGRTILAQVHARLERDCQGHPRQFLTVFFDMTERKQAEAKLAEQLDELSRWEASTIGREGRVLELKKEINDLLARAGQPPRYPSAVEESISEGLPPRM